MVLRETLNLNSINFKLQSTTHTLLACLLHTRILLFVHTGVVGATNMNAHSSRSHAIFTVTVECSDKGPDGKQRVRAGKLHLVDLAVSLLLSYLNY